MSAIIADIGEDEDGAGAGAVSHTAAGAGAVVVGIAGSGNNRPKEAAEESRWGSITTM